MELQMEAQPAENYHSNSQKIRIITETWVGQNIYCPCCGNKRIVQFENNRPVADFFCPHCCEEYELKSKAGMIGNLINDGSYDTMIARINMSNNPNFFFLHYDKDRLKVCDLIFVPKYFFVPDIIIKRKPLAETARRAGWTGCNIHLGRIPEEGKVCLIQGEKQIPMEEVLSKVRRTNFLARYKLNARGWVVDIMSCINEIPSEIFSLNDIYRFEKELGEKYPNNHHIRDKIRQQLQILRDKGILEFQGRGYYRKVQ